MTTLRMKGVRCASLEDFRNNFDFSNARDYLRQGRLSQWVRELGESDLADELDELLLRLMYHMTLKDAAREASEALKLPKKQVYNRALELKNE